MNRRKLLLDQFGISEDKSLLFADGLDDAIIGAVYDHWGTHGWRVVYDREKCVGESTSLFVETLDVS